MRMISGWLALSLLAACDRPAAEPPAASVSDIDAQIAALSEGARNGVFIRAIRDAEQDCQGVETSQVIGDVSGRRAWMARCNGGGEWVIVPSPAGGAQVFNLDEARAAGLVRSAT